MDCNWVHLTPKPLDPVGHELDGKGSKKHSQEPFKHVVDGLTNEVRVAEVHKLSAAHQRHLWELASTAPPLTLDDFVPASLGPKAEQVHHGKNSIPVFSRFEKCFCRGVDGDMIYGYNEGVTRRLIGPGYFVLRTTEGNPDWSGWNYYPNQPPIITGICFVYIPI